QDTAQGPALRIGSGPGRVPAALWGGAKPEGARPHPFAHQTLHGRELLRRSLSPPRGFFTHHIAPYSRVANQGSHVDAAPLPEGIKVLGDRLPGEVDPLLDRA